MESLESIVISLCVFGSATLVIFILARYNYLIRKAYAEKGMERSGKKINFKEIACIVIGIALGLGVSAVLTLLVVPEETMELLIYATILLGGGGGLLAAHKTRKKIEKE
jgi:uncharacterized membrane protein YbjE (DUF340 family)